MRTSLDIRNNSQMRDAFKKPKVEITSYFSNETDLAALMREWPEFVRGDGYDVELRSQQDGECVTTIPEILAAYIKRTNWD